VKNIEKLFDLMVHRADNPGEPFDGVDDKGQQRIIKRSVQAFMHEPVALGRDRFGKPVDIGTRRPIQAFSGSSDLPELTKDVFSVNVEVPNFDLSWQEAYKGMTLRKGELSWEIAAVQGGAEGFQLVPEGGKVKIQSLSADDIVTAYVKKYGYGMGITWETVEGRKLYAFVDQMNEARSRLYENWADIHYGLLDASAATNAIAYQGASTDPQLDRDIRTLNHAAYTIAEACKDKGYGDMANARFLLYISPKYADRIDAALKATNADLVSGRRNQAAAIRWNIDVRYTFNGNVTADRGDMVLPGNKIQNAVYLRELGLSKQEIESLNEIRTYWTAYGGIVADNDQAAQISLA
jgi:hypothetical protein